MTRCRWLIVAVFVGVLVWIATTDTLNLDPGADEGRSDG